MNIAIILAKKNTKRFPNKNFIDYNGYPVIDYTIVKAAECKRLFSRIIISTDNREYKQEMIYYIETYYRNAENCKENAPMYDALMEVIQVMEMKYDFENVCLLYACNPLLTVKIIKDCYDMFISEHYDTAFPIVYNNHILRGLGKADNSNMVYSINSRYNNINTQGYMKTYNHTGMFYWCNVEALKRNKSIMSNNMGGLEISKMQCQDIDDQDDWEIALWKYGRLKNVMR